MAGEQKKRIRFESWKYLQDSDKARELIKNMVKMGSPVVDRGGALSWLVYDELGIRAQMMTEKNLRAEMDETSTYLVQREVKILDADGKPVSNPETGKPLYQIGTDISRIPGMVIDTAFGLRDKGLWSLRGTLTHPILNKEGDYVLINGLTFRDEDVKGVKVKKPVLNLYDGYDPVSQYFFAIPERVRNELSGIQDAAPTTEQISCALEILDDFLCDFVFATRSAKLSALAFMLTMLCREIIEGYVPMMEVRAPESQSGKSLLVKMMIWAITGEEPRFHSPNFRNIEEFEKELFSLLLQGRNYIFLDDVQGTVQSSFLDAALTGKYISKRILGVSASATVYTGMPFVFTANNPTISKDLVNRIYLLDILKPHENKEFRHKLPEKDAYEMGPQIIKALFILYNNWDKNYKREPYRGKRVAGFAEWSNVIGGILQAVGLEGFLDDTLLQIKEIDPRTEQAAYMARLWHEKYANMWVFVKDTFDFAIEAGYVKEKDTPQEKIQTIANKLKKLYRVKLPGGYQFEKNADQSRGSEWRVVQDAGSNG
jgi:hypothetical protein